MLTRREILNQVAQARITIEPFNPGQCGPNSYDLRLCDKISRIMPNTHAQGIDTALPGELHPLPMTQHDGRDCFILMPRAAYLGFTVEYVGSNHYVPNLHGRSTAARHGLTVHFCAGFGDLGWHGQYVLELKNQTEWPLIVYPGDRVAQISFESVTGEIEHYSGNYNGQRGIVGAKGLS